MGYTSPPTFSTGAYLSAAQLNILSDDIEYLRGQQMMPTTGLYRQSSIDSYSGATVTRTGWALMHITNTFRYRISLVQGTSTLLRIRANGQTVYEDTASRSRTNNTDYVWSNTVSISSLPLTVGGIYEISINFTGSGALSRIQIEHLGEDWENTGWSNRSGTVFNDGAVLSATQLNALSTDIKYLYDRSLRSNSGFYSGENIASNSVSGAPSASTVVSGWSLIHLTNTLYYRAYLKQGDAFSWTIRVGGQTVYENVDRPGGVPRIAPYEYAGTVDLTSFGFQTGALYDVSATFRGASQGVNELNLLYVGEVW